MELHEIDKLDFSPDRLKRVVVLTGAGMSAESGVPTFRGDGGLWKQYRPEELATPQAFAADPEIVWEWYQWRRNLIAKSEPNPGHVALVELEELLDENYSLITQNVDGLHTRAGSKNPIELHGNIFVNRCNECSAHFADDGLNFDSLPPQCPTCNGPVRPGVVWFGEGLNPIVIEDAYTKSHQAKAFLCVGTSAIVHPAASLPLTAKDNAAYLIEVNPESTPLSPIADVLIRETSAKALPRIVERIRSALNKD
jgi:NAD-dependent deacetylase